MRMGEGGGGIELVRKGFSVGEVLLSRRCSPRPFDVLFSPSLSLSLSRAVFSGRPQLVHFVISLAYFIWSL